MFSRTGPLLTEERARRHGWIIITLAVLVVYWPLSTFHYAINGGDTFDCWLPWRWFITLSLKNGQLPIWNPLQQMGYPVYADLQGPAWYPEAIALGGTIGHSLRTLQALFLGYLIIGGIGFMRLCNVVHGVARIGVITGVAYALCGFLTAHQMHFYSVISAAWMPWLLAAQVKLMRTPHWKTAVEAAVPMMLLLTGGNHTFTIVAAYLLAALFAVHVIDHWRRGDRRLARTLLVHEAAFVAITVLMACGTLYAWIEVGPYLGRTKGLPYELAASGAFTWEALPSWFFPAQMGNTGWNAGTDPPMANGYMGVLMLAFAFCAVVRERSRLENVFAVFALICALLAFGDALPFYRWVWRWLPGLDVFRFPSYFLYLTMLGVLLLAGGSLRAEARWRWDLQRSHLVGLGIALLAGTVLLIALPERFAAAPADALRRSLFEWIRALGHHERLLASWGVTAPLLLVAIVLTIRKKLTTAVVLVLVLVEMGWNTHFAQWTSAVSDFHPAVLDARLAQFPQGPILPGAQAMGSNTDNAGRSHLLWRNTQNFEGNPTHDGFNSFWPDHTYHLMNEHRFLAEAMKTQPLVYLSDRVATERAIHPDQVDPQHASDAVFLPIGGPLPTGLRRSPNDHLELTHFNYSRLTLSSSTVAPTFLLVQQSWFPGWTIRIDGEPAEVIRANVAAFGTVLPAGEHQVEVHFEKPMIPWLLGLSLATFLGALAVLSLSRTGPRRWLALCATTGLAGMISWSLFAHRGIRDEAPRASIPMIITNRQPEDHTAFTAATDHPIALSSEHPFSPAFVTRADSLRTGDARSLIVTFEYKRLGRVKGLLVVQRSANGKTTDYDPFPFAGLDGGDTTWTTGSIMRDIRELRYLDEEVGIYLWNQGPDTLLVRDIHVRTSPRAPWRE